LKNKIIKKELKKKCDLSGEDFPEHFLEEERGPAGPAVLLGPVSLERAGQLALDLKHTVRSLIKP
jgi:hypothetical protein